MFRRVQKTAGLPPIHVTGRLFMNTAREVPPPPASLREAFRCWLRLDFISFGGLKFTAPLTGITAAAVGVILNLAVFFAWHVLWPEAAAAAPFSGRFEWAMLVIGAAAFVALFRFGAGRHSVDRRVRRRRTALHAFSLERVAMPA